MVIEYILFSLLTLMYVSFLFIGFRYNEHKKSLVIFYVISTIIFYTPSIYYSIFLGEAYKVFSAGSYLQYLAFSILYFLIITLLIIVKNSINFSKNITFNHSSNKLVYLYMGYVTAAILAYVVFYFDRFPLINLVLEGSRIERPDMSGSIPLYFTFSTFIFFIIPSYYLYFYDRIQSNVVKLILFAAVSIILLIGGNKGVLVYFYIFFWIFIFKMKINFKLLTMVVIAFSAYLFITGSLVTSGIRRFFVTQGAAFIARFEMLNIDFPFDLHNIDGQVFEFIYGYPDGSGPSFFVGDFFIHIGYIIGTATMLLIFLVFFYISRFIDVHFKNNLFILWSFTAVIYILGMGSLDFPAFCRIVAISLNAIIVVSLQNTKSISNFAVNNLQFLGFKGALAGERKNKNN
ncbi:hypothetical protein [Gracilibacillus kekensis]|uniref:Oligosaccharide repeat unit polymerase n=1 Tax=Gracilibacillus kekensis TaxID=1027249 RepID=A0A1M7K8K2_9BACI|nr:hypothetical protein [Gracilibacillus kekensis]SHM61177.1 hypothetical protein SAMN05216179_0604 [Gracilibacillus kekensis]